MRRELFIVWLLTGALAIADDRARSFYVEEAKRMAEQPYAPGFTPPTKYAEGLSYDALQRIRVKQEQWIFNQSAGNLKIEPRLAGSYNSKGVHLGVLRSGIVQAIPFK